MPRCQALAIRFPLVPLTLMVALCTIVNPTAAQERPTSEFISSDRPGLGDGAHVLGTGVWQLEAGATFQDAGSGDTEGLGSALVRWGIAPLELRFYLPSPIVSRGDGGVEVGDLGVGVKTGIRDGASWRWSLVGGATLPTGTDAASARDPGGFATFVGETSLTETVAFALNLGYSATFEDFGDGGLSVIATPSFPVADNVSAYAGYAGFFNRVGDDAHWLEAGLALSRTDDTQWDLNAGWDAQGDAWFFGVGVATRWR